MFEKITGNQDVKARLIKMVRDGRVPQALIFAGRDGIGKKQFALELAESLVCKAKVDGLPCGTCPPCSRAVRFTLPTSGKKEDYERVLFSGHPDVGMIIPNKNTIYVDAIRALADEAHFRPYEADARFFIIDEAEKLGLTNKAAANALLKTLEEPAPTTYLTLITSKPSALLQTIRSRCQMIRFAPVDEASIESHLIETGVSSTDAGLLARISKGSVGGATAIDLEEYRVLRQKLMDVVETAVRGGGMAEGLRVSEEIAVLKEADGYEKSIDLLETVVRDLLLIKRQNRGQLINIDLEKDLSRMASEISAARLSAWILEIEQLKRSLRVNINKKIGTDALFVSMAGR